MDIIPPTAPNVLTCDTAFSSYVLIVDAYFKIPKNYVTEKISTEEVMGKLDMFQSRFGKNRQIWMVGLKAKEKNVVTLPHCAHRKHEF